MKPRRSRRTYRAIIAIAGAVVLPSCDDATDPGLRFAQLDLALEFQYAGAGVPEIGTIRVLLTRTSDASVARDTTIGVPADADSVELTVTVMVRTPDETFTLTLELREPGGAIVFSGGPVIVTPAATSTPPVVVVPIRYVGVGANAAGIEITSSAPSLLAGDTALLSAVARDSGGVAIPGTPIVWRSLDSVQGRVPQPDSGLVIAGAVRGGLRIVAGLLTGQEDTTSILIQARPERLVADSGNEQSGPANALLPDPLVARVIATDSLGVEGLWVRFQVANGGGSLSMDSALTDGTGRARVSWTFGPALGLLQVQQVVATTPQLPSDTARFREAPARWTWVTGDSVVFRPSVYGTPGIPDPANTPGARRFGVAWTDRSGNFWMHGGDRGGNELWRFDGSYWTWVSGGTAAVYGTKGVADPANLPGGRTRAAGWIDAADGLWLFGGTGSDAAGRTGDLNDLWRFDGVNWTWVSGDSLRRQQGVYGTRGVPDPANVPGARVGSASWIDAGGNLWLFGGRERLTIDYRYNDLWRFDGVNWTWVSGSSSDNQRGFYGTQGVPDPANVPGARIHAAFWSDQNGNFWLFGGDGLDADSVAGRLNDLWRFDGTSWAWISGSPFVGQPGRYGVRGVPDPANTPGARAASAAWTDASGTVWLFGGDPGTGGTTSPRFNDLWRYDSMSWTWVSGDSATGQPGVYGTRGIPGDLNVPGARSSHASWMDAGGNLWLFGGRALTAGSNDYYEINDLWRFGK